MISPAAPIRGVCGMNESALQAGEIKCIRLLTGSDAADLSYSTTVTFERTADVRDSVKCTVTGTDDYRRHWSECSVPYFYYNSSIISKCTLLLCMDAAVLGHVSVEKEILNLNGTSWLTP